MEILKDKIKEFLALDTGSGYGHGRAEGMGFGSCDGMGCGLGAADAASVVKSVLGNLKYVLYVME